MAVRSVKVLRWRVNTIMQFGNCWYSSQHVMASLNPCADWRYQESAILLPSSRIGSIKNLSSMPRIRMEMCCKGCETRGKNLHIISTMMSTMWLYSIVAYLVSILLLYILIDSTVHVALPIFFINCLSHFIIIIRVLCPRAGPSVQAQEPKLQFCRKQVYTANSGTKAAVLPGIE